jgi:heterotetrameric sarcosine oxidase delta subunit
MLSIACPWCGPREETEFRYGGEGIVIPSNADDSTWARTLYYRANPAGLFTERWVHVHGCRQWFEVVRDTTTHAIHATRPLGGADPNSP